VIKELAKDWRDLPEETKAAYPPLGKSITPDGPKQNGNMIERGQNLWRKKKRQSWVDLQRMVLLNYSIALTQVRQNGHIVRCIGHGFLC
jgi:hypothetical protein